MIRDSRRLLTAFAILDLALSLLFIGPASVALAAPTNDNIANAVALQSNSGVWHSNVGATMQFQETSGCGPVGATLWYKWTSPGNSYVTVTTWESTTSPTPTTFDTILDIYSGPTGAQFFSDLTRKQCMDDQGSSLHSGVDYLAQAGQTYYIQVGGYNAATGNVRLQISFLSLASRICSTTNHYFSMSCWSPSTVVAGNRAAWASNALNISDDAAHGGGHIQNSVWLYNNPNTTNFSYMELADTAGTGLTSGGEPTFGNNRPFLWERWWVFIDGYTDAGQNGHASGHYTVNYLASAPSDGLRRHYVLKWEPSIGWSAQICTADGACTVYATRTWIDPTTMIQPRLATGLEVGAINFNDNSNIPTSGTFQNDTMQVADTAGNWSGWSSASSDVDNGCSTISSPFCLNGAYLAGPPPYDNWRFNKP